MTEVDGNVYSLLCHNHLHNVWVKNILTVTTDFLRGVLHDSLDNIVPKLRVPPGFDGFAYVFDKEFSLCANYPKGRGKLFLMWMKEIHPMELLLHVMRAASSGRQDVCLMAALAMFWNRNYCLEFLEHIIRYCGKEDNILVQNLFSVLSSVEMVVTSWLWSIFHLSIIQTLCYLVANTHKFAEYGWGLLNCIVSWAVSRMAWSPS